MKRLEFCAAFSVALLAAGFTPRVAAADPVGPALPRDSLAASKIQHVLVILQENHTFDNYFGMLNPYRRANNWTTSEDGHVYTVDGIDDKLNTTNKDDEGVAIPLFKLKSTCIDDAVEKQRRLRLSHPHRAATGEHVAVHGEP